jgi:hypothetical protein
VVEEEEPSDLGRRRSPLTTCLGKSCGGKGRGADWGMVVEVAVERWICAFGGEGKGSGLGENERRG